MVYNLFDNGETLPTASNFVFNLDQKQEYHLAWPKTKNLTRRIGSEVVIMKKTVYTRSNGDENASVGLNSVHLICNLLLFQLLV